jgi:hypothetical protein
VAKGKKIPFSLAKGMWSGGDAATIPAEAARKLRNMVRKNGPWVARPQFTYDNLAGVRGLGVWYDDATATRRLVACTTAALLHLKASSGETWTNPDADSFGASRILDSASYGGALYMALCGATTKTPTGIESFDGVDHDVALIPLLYPRTVTAYKDRLFMGAPRLFVVNQFGATWSSTSPYDASEWTETNVTTTMLTSGDTTTCRIAPTNTTNASLVGQAVALTTPSEYPQGESFAFRSDLRGVHPTYAMPVTLSLKFTSPAWLAATGYVVGNYAVPGNGYIYRCTVAGTSHAATEPVWPTTIGGTITDNTVTWTCEATDTAGESRVWVPSVSDSPDFSTFYCVGRSPAGQAPTPLSGNGSLAMAPVITFGHGSAITLAALDFSYQDGLASSDAAHQNYGQQVTSSDFLYPFFAGYAGGGAFSSGTAAFIEHAEYIYWSEVGRPKEVATQNYYRLREVPGAVTAIRSVGGKLVAFKRNAFWIFGATNDPDNPILPEGDARVGTGCLNAKAIDVFEDFAYFVGEDEIYRMTPGDVPEPLCGDGMRDEIMDKSPATWAESQSAPSDRVLLTIDQRRRRLWAYTQKGKLYCYDIDTKAWSVHDAGGDASTTATGKQVCDMIYGPNTGHVYVAFSEATTGTAGLARLDETQTGAEDQISTTGTLPIYKDIWLRPVELDSREDVCLEQLDIYHKITASQTDQTLTAYHSFDHGVNFSTFETLTVSPVSGGEHDPIQIPCYQSGGTILPRVLHTGKGGAENFNVSRIVATVEVLSGDGAYPTETA